MAKKKELSLQEKLDNALVPNWEQPYAVPENWVWTKLNYAANYRKGPFGSSITKAMFVEKGENTYKVYEQGNAIQKDKNYGNYYITKEKFEELKSFEVNSKDIIVSCAGTIGETFEIPDSFENGIINQALMRVRISQKINKNYYLLYFDAIIQGDIEKKAKGTAIKNIPPFAVLKELPFPLPPLEEQERIVNRIESLFAKLDKAQELIEESLASFDTRKSALLHQAFTGELTKKWREENGVSFDSWEEKNLKDISRIVRGGSPRPAGDERFYNGNIPFMKVADITREKSPFIKSAEYSLKEAGLKKSRLVSAGTLLLTNSGATLGVPGITTIDTAFNDGIAAFLELQVDTMFVYYLLTSKTLELRLINMGAAQPNLNIEIISNIKINIPTLPEQKEIVRILDSILKKEEEAKAFAQNSLKQIAHMKKAILARAFRGELGTNNKNDENALELLKEILSII